MNLRSRNRVRIRGRPVARWVVLAHEVKPALPSEPTKPTLPVHPAGPPTTTPATPWTATWHQAPQRRSDRTRTAVRPGNGTRRHSGPTPGLRRSGLAGRWHPALRLHGPPFPCLGGRAGGPLVAKSLASATPPDRRGHGPHPPGARLRCRRWPAPIPSVAGGARGWISLPSMMPSSRDERPQKSNSGGHFDLDLLEATPGIEPGIAVLQTAALPLG